MSPAPAPAPVPSGASPEGHILALARAGRRDEALAFARGAVDGARVTGVDALLATLLVNAGEREEARGVIEAARARPSDDPRACDALAHAALRLGAHRLSRDFYARAARLAPGDAGAWYNLAASERALGALEAAGEACDAAIACDGDHAASHLLRSELRVQSADDNHVDVLRAALARAPQDGPGRVALGYALAKELDDLGESAAAWAAWTAAAAARRAQMAYDVATDEAKLARIAQVFTQGPEPLPCRKARRRLSSSSACRARARPCSNGCSPTFRAWFPMARPTISRRACWAPRPGGRTSTCSRGRRWPIRRRWAAPMPRGRRARMAPA
jgi:hypothetical protein